MTKPSSLSKEYDSIVLKCVASSCEGLQFENNCLTEMCSGSEAGSYLRFLDFVYHSTLGLRVIKKKKRVRTCLGSSIGCPGLFEFV